LPSAFSRSGENGRLPRYESSFRPAYGTVERHRHDCDHNERREIFSQGERLSVELEHVPDAGRHNNPFHGAVSVRPDDFQLVCDILRKPRADHQYSIN
jgi:hypothetical protein